MKGYHLIASIAVFYSLSGMSAVVNQVPAKIMQVPSLTRIVAEHILKNMSHYDKLISKQATIKSILGYYACRLQPQIAWKLLAEGITIEDHQGGVLGATFTKGNTAVIATSDGSLWIRDFKKNMFRVTRIHTARMNAIVISLDKSCLVTASQDGKAKLVTLSDGMVKQEYFHIHPMTSIAIPVTCVAISSDNRHVLTGSLDGKVRLFDALEGRCLETLEHSSTGQIYAVSFFLNGIIASIGADHVVKLWDKSTGFAQRQIGATDITKMLVTAAFCPTEGRALMAYDTSCEIVSLNERQEQTAKVINEGNVRSIGFSEDQKMFLIGSDNKHAILFAGTITQLGHAQPIATFNGHTRPVRSVAISPDNASLVCGDNESPFLAAPNGKLVLWTFKNLAKTLNLDQAAFVLSLPEMAQQNYLDFSSHPEKAAHYLALPERVKISISRTYPVILPQPKEIK